MQQELERQLNEIGSSDEKLTLVLAELEEVGAELEKQAQLLSQIRKEAAGRLSPLISKELSELGMPDAELAIELKRTEVSSLGQDEIEIKFSSNKGQQLQDISKVASGGELSRLMLSVKAQIAENAKLPAIIFDEIDTGVSGDVANKVGYKIKELSSNMQVFCITHLPQVAAKAQQHLFVYKELEEGKTVTKVRALTENERITEIAKMLSSANPTEQALAHARNLVDETK
jgi:DNA repair protein RecN (Recombination protein N)